jgi:hypothetical protein
MKPNSKNINLWILLLGISLGVCLGPQAQAQTGDALAKAALDPVNDSARIANSEAKPKPLRILVIGAPQK